jgi:uncharacterized metal-binding protein YceD (DUF177 family)
MSAGSPDLVDCGRLAEEAVRLRRVYELGELPRLEGLLAEPKGTLEAEFDFVKLASGRSGAAVTIEAVPQLVCQRCMQGFDCRVTSASQIEFADPEERQMADSERECVVMQNGRVSLQSLAEEEFLLALPIAPACTAPLTCGRAPGRAAGAEERGATVGMRRPFSALQDLLKKT